MQFNKENSKKNLPSRTFICFLAPAMSLDIINYYKPESTVLTKISGFIDRHESFVLTTHIGSDADGIGSQVGFAMLLEALGKKVLIINNERPTNNLSFLDPENRIKDINDIPAKDLPSLFDNSFVFILDSSEPARSKKVADSFLDNNTPWATIDHHDLPEQENFCIDPSYAATAELIWDVYRFYKVDISKQAALSLYGGLVADSGNFRYGKTSMRTHLAGGHLLESGIDTDQVYRALYESHPVDRLRYTERIIKKAIINKEKGYIAGVIVKKMRKGLDLGDSPNEGIVNQLLAAKGIRLAALMTETDDGQLKCSLRSIGNIDVNKMAATFGGGGHKNAAGFKANRKFRKARKAVITLIDETLS